MKIVFKVNYIYMTNSRVNNGTNASYQSIGTGHNANSQTAKP